jgi:hypothetical protein
MKRQVPFAFDCMDAGGRASKVSALGDAGSGCREPVPQGTSAGRRKTVCASTRSPEQPKDPMNRKCRGTRRISRERCASLCSVPIVLGFCFHYLSTTESSKRNPRLVNFGRERMYTHTKIVETGGVIRAYTTHTTSIATVWTRKHPHCAAQ